MENQRSGREETIQSVVMALDVLETVANANEEIGVTALASALQTTKSRIHRHLRTLLKLGYISQSENSDRYKIGPRLIALGQSASRSMDISSVALPHMRTLRDITGQAVTLGKVDNRGIRILTTLPGKMQIDVGVKPGSLLGLSNSAQGKVALASMPRKMQTELIPDVIPQSTEFTITNKEQIFEHLKQVSADGWATAPNETVLGLNALASPIFNVENEVVATIAIVSLTQYIESPPSREQVDAVLNTAKKISEELGHIN